MSLLACASSPVHPVDRNCLGHTRDLTAVWKCGRRDLIGLGFCLRWICEERQAFAAEQAKLQFYELEGSGGVKALDIRIGSGEFPKSGDEVAIHYYGRLAAKQGWRFDSTYDHKDASGIPQPFVFTIGSNQVIKGLDSTVKSMKSGGIRRAVIPPSQGYQNNTQEPLPPNFFDRQRLFTTIFNPTRAANGESSTLGTLVFDVELLRIVHSSSEMKLSD